MAIWFRYFLTWKVGHYMSELKEKTDEIKLEERKRKNQYDSTNYSLMHSRLRGHTALYLKIPMYFSLIFLPVIAWMWKENENMAILAGVCFIVYVALTVGLYFYEKNKYVRELVEFASDYSQVQKQLIKGIELPYGLIDKDGRILWCNQPLMNLRKNTTSKNISEVFPDIKLDVVDFEEKEGRPSTYISVDSGFYRVDFVKIPLETKFTSAALELERKTSEESDTEVSENEEYLIAIYLFDETEVKRLSKENYEQKMVAGLIYLDNYDDALDSVEDVRKSLLIALIDRSINKFFAQYNAVVRKLEKDKYFIVMKQKHIAALQSSKFSILDEVKTVNIGNEMAVTVSIGFGVNGDEYTQSCDYARVAIDLALGRGGDQAVVKDGEKIYFYGGKSKQVEKNTRVKARVKAHALRELLETKEKVIIMGHKIGDIDSLGSAVGIFRAAKTINKKAYIVINEITSSIRPMLEILMEAKEYEEIFVNSEDAIDLVDSNTAIVVVDVSRPSYVECPEILSKVKDVVILDHHRRSSDVIENASLSYIEPYASSASEMVAEILQYFYDGIKIMPYEAEAMYAGIMIDTNTFTKNTGVRTFEAAAFLRKCGVDVSHVKQLFRDSMDDYKAKAKTISSAEAFGDKFAISVCPSEGLDSPTVVGAQAANELLNISGIKASFVLTEHNGKIYVSARSMGDISVQLVMEKLGGGGHLDTAGAQLENVSVSEAKELIKDTVMKMLEEKEI